ncbi:MAG: type II toxin-antitoxin system VapC family toxin [Deltaproteobacteria bacterium]|nr:type II toxin-antitoxin system VapC family toxin [Deltaproteobacteria bacterium]
MKRILLDTSAYSEFMRGNENVGPVIQRAVEIHLPPVVLGELKAGFLRGRYRKKNLAELETFLSSPRVHVPVIDEDTADAYAEILFDLRGAGTPIPTNDLWIAACAMQHGLRLVTCDAHFGKVRQIMVESIARGR